MSFIKWKYLWLQAENYSIVFSFWTSTLDLVESGLKNVSIACVRFDGQGSQKQRQAAIDSFRSDPDVRVMLLTFSCGAVG